MAARVEAAKALFFVCCFFPNFDDRKRKIESFGGERRTKKKQIREAAILSHKNRPMQIARSRRLHTEAKEAEKQSKNSIVAAAFQCAQNAANIRRHAKSLNAEKKVAEKKWRKI